MSDCHIPLGSETPVGRTTSNQSKTRKNQFFIRLKTPLNQNFKCQVQYRQYSNEEIQSPFTKKYIKKIWIDKSKMKLLTKDKNKKSPLKQIMHLDQEFLCQEIKELKVKLNKTCEENQILKAKYINSDEEVNKLIRVVQKKKFSGVIAKQEKWNENINNVDQDQLLFMLDLQRQNRDLKNKIGCQEDQIQQLLRSQKIQKIHELEIELEEYRMELDRMKNMLQQSLLIDQINESQFQEKSKDSFIYLKKRNIEMVAKIKELQKNNASQKQVIEELEANNQKIQGSNFRLKSILKQVQKDLKEKKQNDSTKHYREEHSLQFEELKSDNKKYKTHIAELNIMLQQRDKKFQELDNKFKDYVTDNRQKQMKTEKETKNLKEKLREKTELLNQALQSTQGRRKCIQSLKNIMQQQQESNVNLKRSTSILQEDDMELQDQSSNQSSVESTYEIKHPVIQKGDIVDLGKEIKYQLRTKGVPLQDLDQYLFQTANLLELEDQEYFVSIKSLKDQFIKPPFELKNDDALKLARYLVEETDERFVIIDISQTASIARVRSILRNLLNNYKLFQDENCIINEIRTSIIRFKEIILDYIMKTKAAKGNNEKYCSIEDFCDSLTYVDAQISSSQLEFILQKNYELSGSLNKFYYHSIIQMLIENKQ